MTKLYGRGTLIEIIKGRKYRIKFSGGKNPLSGRVYGSGSEVPGNAYAVDNEGKQVRPKVVYGKASEEQRASFDCWKTPIEYHQVTETFLGTRRQAQLRIEEIRRELESGKAVNADKVTFSDWCERYLSTRESMGKHRTNTYKADRCYSKHLVRGLGDIRVIDITPSVVDGLYVGMKSAGVGETTLLQCHKLLKRIMAYAVDNDLIMKNPVACVETPRKPKPRRNALSTAEARRLGEICASGTLSPNKTAVYLGLALGARLGEVLGLTWGDIALDGGRPFAHVVRQYAGGGETGPLKTDKDDNPIGRVVPLDASTVAVLRAWKVVQRAALNDLGIEQGLGTPVVSNRVGGFSEHRNFNKWFRSFCVEYGYGRWLAEDGREIVTLVIGDDPALHPDRAILWRDSRGWPCDESGRRFSRSYRKPAVKRHYDGLVFHELRHTHFTIRLASGMDIPTAQALGGWDSPDMLMTVYAHPVLENVWNAAGFMDELVSKEDGQKRRS